MKCFHFLLSFENFFSLFCSTLSIYSLSSRHKSSPQGCAIEKAVLKHFVILTRRHLCQNLCEYCKILKSTNFEEHLRTAATADSFTMFYLQCFDFMSNTVCIICIMLVITLYVKVNIKIMRRIVNHVGSTQVTTCLPKIIFQNQLFQSK